MADFTDDLLELVTNPGLLTKSVGYGMGNWTPAGLRPGPALQGIGDMLLAARQNVQEQQAGKSLADLSSEVGNQGTAATPPTINPDGSPAQLPPGFISLPPGMSRSQVLSRVGNLPNASEMFRFLGKNRGSASLFDTIMGAGESQYEAAQKQRELVAQYPNVVQALEPLHGPEQARVLASQALLNKTAPGLPQQFFTTSPEELQTKRISGQRALKIAQSEQAFDNELSQSGFNSNDPNTYGVLRDLSGRYPMVNAQRAFQGNLPGLQRYINDQTNSIRNEMRDKFNMDVIFTGKVDKDGNPSMEMVPIGAALPSTDKVKQMARDAYNDMSQMVQAAPTVFGPVMQPYLAGLRGAMETGNFQAYRDAMQHGSGLMIAHENSERMRDIAEENRLGRSQNRSDTIWERANTTIQGLQKQLKDDVQGAAAWEQTEAVRSGTTYDGKRITKEQLTPGVIERARRYQDMINQLRQFQQALPDLLLTGGVSESRAVLGGALGGDRGPAPRPPGIPLAPVPPGAPGAGVPGKQTFAGVINMDDLPKGFQFRINPKADFENDIWPQYAQQLGPQYKEALRALVAKLQNLPQGRPAPGTVPAVPPVQ